MQQLAPNALLQGGKYKIIKVLGQGGFGITYLAEQVMLGRKVAVKEFFMKELCDRDNTTSHVSVGSSGSTETVERFKDKFLKEARLIASMDNNHIVRIHDIFEENGTAYYIMENIDGGSVENIVKDGCIPEARALEIIKEIGSALNYIHKQNVLHLDVKPSNILLRSNGEAVLIDFGISKRYDDEGGQTSTTPAGISKGYAPIEQYNQGLTNFSPATDVYSLGATLYKMISAITPPEASLLLDEDEELIKPSSVSSSTWNAIIKAMEPRRKKRTQSINDFMSNLQATQSTVYDETTRILNASQSNRLEETVLVTPSQNKYNGSDYVDLGLSVKWAKFNVGTQSEKDKGTLYSFANGKENESIPKCICGSSELDICRQIMGGLWRLPSNSELTELRTKCKWEYNRSTNCYKITGPNGNSIILPSTHTQMMIGAVMAPVGRYWSGDLHVKNQSTAYYLYFDGRTNEISWRNDDIACQFAVRGVIE